MRTRGIGTIEAWPDENGVCHLAEVDCEIRLNRALRVWVVQLKTGGECIIPMEMAVVTWPTPTVVPDVVFDNADSDKVAEDLVKAADLTVGALFASGRSVKLTTKPPMKPAPYKCEHCNNYYVSPVEAAVCRIQCDPKAAPFVGGSCKLCGFPNALHEGAASLTAYCRLVAQGVVTEVPWSRPQKALTPSTGAPK